MSHPRTGEHSEAGAAVSRVYAALRVPIVDGEIAPGTRINIDAVARKLGVSQTPVREALQRLEGDDLLTYTPGRGYRTTPMLDPSRFRSLFEFRLLLEPWAARAAAADRLANPATELEEEMRVLERIVNTPSDVRQEMLVHDTRFHDLILAAAGNEVVRQAFAQTHCHLHVFRLYPVDADGHFTFEEHGRIVAAIRDGDAEAAERAMTEHIRNSYTRSSKAFTGQTPDIGSPHPARQGTEL